MNAAQIEDVMITRLKAASDAGVLGYTLRDVTGYGGQLDPEMGNIARNFPAAWVTFAGIKETDELHAGSTYREKLTFAVICAAESKRNEQVARKGGGSRIGALQICKDVRRLFAGQTLGLDIRPMIPTAVEPVIAGAKYGDDYLAVFACGFDTEDALALEVDWQASAAGAPVTIGDPAQDANPLSPGDPMDLRFFRPDLDPPVAPIGDFAALDTNYDKPGPGPDPDDPDADDGKLHDITEMPQ